MCMLMLHQNLGFAYLMVGKSFKKNNIFLPQKGDDLVMAKESKKKSIIIPSPALTKKRPSPLKPNNNQVKGYLFKTIR